MKKFTLFICSLMICLSSISWASPRYSNYIDPMDFGVIGDGIVNDYAALQAAIDSAEITGSTIMLPAGIYNIDQMLVVPGGVTLIGEGRGREATQTPNSGTIIKNIGNSTTLSIIGSNASIRDLVVYDTDNAGAAAGITIVADAKLIESVVLKNVLIFGFTDGPALKLHALNHGGIGYSSFYDIGIRHAKTGILIEQDATSFVNSNTFFHGFISGGGFDYCLRVLGGNNNVFHATIMEPYTSQYGHIVVENGQIIGENIRVEGNQQGTTAPLIEFKEQTSGSVLTGIYSGGLTTDSGDNFINFHSGKSLDPINSTSNLFQNSAFNGATNNTIPFWELSGTGITVDVMPAEMLANHRVLKLTIPVGLTTYLRPIPQYLPTLLSSYKYDHINFGAYVKTDQPNLITTTCKAPMGLTTGLYHPGDGEWHVVGMSSGTNRTSYYDPRFYISNGGNSPAYIYITVPTMNFGKNSVQLEASTITSAGGIITGTLSMGIAEVSTGPTGFLTLPKYGNIFEIDGTGLISRINHTSANRFPKGTVITLLFNSQGASISNSAYIVLKSGFTSAENGSITLIAKDSGTWRELSRSN